MTAELLTIEQSLGKKALSILQDNAYGSRVSPTDLAAQNVVMGEEK